MTMNQTEGLFEEGPGSPASARESLLARVRQSSPLPLSEAGPHVDELRTLIQGGYVSLRIVQYAWGLDFELVPTSRALGAGDMRR